MKTRTKTESDIIIIGAGASGLMAAKTLSENGGDFLILESTDRIGGRALTMEGNLPVELGPEFLHGETPLTDSLLENFGLPWYDLNFNHHLYLQGKLRPLPDFWDRLCDVFQSLEPGEKDLSFHEYLNRFDHHSLFDQKIAKSFVQGFDAADLTSVSTMALKDMKPQACDPKMRRMRRPLDGYGCLLSRIAEPLERNIRFAHTVEEIKWREGSVIVRGVSGEGRAPFEMRAKKVILTSSVAVLKKLRISPLPQGLRDFLGRTEMGHVMKMVAEMDKEFFHQFDEHTFPFIVSPDLCFTAWWTTTPLHTRYITAWSGGDKARKLETKSPEERMQIFIRELADMTGQCPAKIGNWVKKIHHYDWSGNESFLGAYSYPVVSGNDRTLTETSFEDTLFLAGEAFHEEFSGTIEGAFLTGKRAAEKVTRSGESADIDPGHNLPLSP